MKLKLLRNRPWWLGDAGFIAGIVAVAAAGTLWARPGVTPAHRLVRDPLKAILPPGAVAGGSGLKSALLPTRALIVVPIHKNLLLAIAPNATFTCDIGAGAYDGVNLYEQQAQGNLVLVKQFGRTNVFAVSLDTNFPHWVQVRTFINWPAPGVVGSVTLEDGTTENFTNTFYESGGTDFIYVPTNCPGIALFTAGHGMVLAGWNGGTNLQIDSSPDLKQWGEITHITTPGAFLIAVDGTQRQMFWRWKQ